jgi:quinol monooxygenase YgiN
VIHLRNAIEANLLEAILRERGVPHYIKVYRDASFKGSWSFIDAWGHVECAEEHEEEVRRVLEGIRSGGR